jgi:hypothetical protein
MGTFFSMQFGKQTAGFLALAMTLVFCGHLVATSIRKTIQFDTAQELKEFAVSKGLAYHSGSTSGISGNTYYLADHPLTFNGLEPVCTRRACGLTPAWRGILWVSQIHNPSTTFFPEQLGGKWRVWGNVCVAGDEALMDRIQEFYTENK